MAMAMVVGDGDGDEGCCDGEQAQGQSPWHTVGVGFVG